MTMPKAVNPKHCSDRLYVKRGRKGRLNSSEMETIQIGKMELNKCIQEFNETVIKMDEKVKQERKRKEQVNK